MIYIGTSGYSYPDWVGTFYPPGSKQTDFIHLFQESFSFVELNYSYYRMPERKHMASFLSRLEEDTIFTIKAPGLFTHERNPSQKDFHGLKDSLQESLEKDKCKALILQFPYSFKYQRESRLYLDNLCKNLEGIPLAIEMRSNEWNNPSFIQGLKERRISLIHTDQPSLKGLWQGLSEPTTSLGYIRFHGRNSENWWTGDNVSRYDYLYNAEELSSWLDKIGKMAEKVKVLLVAFNNHSKGKAVQNARQLRKFIEKAGLQVT
jgi:uncharacterized protein YecE (DUF72 family)